jgi:hypothetical protein
MDRPSRSTRAHAAAGRPLTIDWTEVQHEVACGPTRPTTANEKAKMVAGAVTAVIMTAVLFVVVLAFLLPQ